MHIISQSLSYETNKKKEKFFKKLREKIPPTHRDLCIKETIHVMSHWTMIKLLSQPPTTEPTNQKVPERIKKLEIKWVFSFLIAVIKSTQFPINAEEK